MAGYQFDTLSQKQRQDILNFCAGFEKFMADRPIKKDRDGNLIETETTKGMPREVVDYGWRTFQEVVGEMRATLDGGRQEHNLIAFSDQTESERVLISFHRDFDEMVSVMRGRLVSLCDFGPELFEQLKSSIPEAEDFLNGIEMPEPGTAGYQFDHLRDYVTYISGDYSDEGPQISKMDEIGLQRFAATAIVLDEVTKGAKDWRKVKINAEEVLERTNEVFENLACNASFNDMVCHVTEGASEVIPTLYKEDIKDIKEELDERYCTQLLPAFVKKMNKRYSEQLKTLGDANEFRKDEKEKLSKSFMQDMTMAGIAESNPKKFNNYQAIEKEERKYRRVYESFVNSKPAREVAKLFTGKPGKVLEAVQEYAPPAKTRIEELQSKLKKEKDPTAKMRLTAEIIANRELAGAQLGGKGLENRPDPVAVAARTEELAAEMSKVRESDPEAMDKVVAQATRGHGGKMMEAYNTAAQPTREAAEKAAREAAEKAAHEEAEKAAREAAEKTAREEAEKAAREAEKPVSYLDYINKLNLENPTSQDVAKLVAATGLLITQKEGAQAIADPKEIDKIAAAIDNEPAFQNMMKDQQVIQNAKMGLGLPLMEQLNAKKKAAEMEKKTDETEKKTDEAEKKTAETEKKADETEKTEATKKPDEATLKAQREKKQAEHDAAQIEKDVKNPKHRLESDKGFFNSLRQYGKEKEFNDIRRRRVQDYLNTYPSCRAEAMEIIAENKLTGLTMPKIREVPDAMLIHPEKNKAALQKQQEQEKQQEKQPEVKPQKQEQDVQIGG